MSDGHERQVEALLLEAAADHERLMSQLPQEIRESLPVDAQGLTRAIDHLAMAAGLSLAERRALVRPHGINPAVLHARVFGAAPLAPETVIGAFVEGARVRADALAALADVVGGEELGQQVRTALTEFPPPAGGAVGEESITALRETYAAQERAAVMIATRLDSA